MAPVPVAPYTNGWAYPEPPYPTGWYYDHPCMGARDYPNGGGIPRAATVALYRPVVRAEGRDLTCLPEGCPAITPLPSGGGADGCGHR